MSNPQFSVRLFFFSIERPRHEFSTTLFDFFVGQVSRVLYYAYLWKPEPQKSPETISGQKKKK